MRTLNRLRRATAGESGFTIIEILVAMLVFVVLITAVVSTMVAALNLTRNNRSRSVAANLASQQVDSVQQAAAQDFSSLPVGETILTQTVDGTAYTITQDLEWQSKSSQVGPCSGGTTASGLAYLHVQETVTWPNMRGTVAPLSETLLTPPVGTYDPTTGHIAVTVIDRNAQPIADANVTISGNGVGSTQATASDGCAFFAYLDPGTYTITMNSSGFVDGQGNPNPSQSATVTAGTITSLQFVYGQASSLTLNFSGPTGSIMPPSFMLTVANTSLLPDGTNAYGPGGSSQTVSSLFPYLSGYQAWAGDCIDSDPGGSKRIAPVAMTPGGNSTAAVVMPGVKVVVKNTSGVVQANQVVLFKHATDNQCPAGDTLTYTKTDATGTLTAATPYGLWTVQVQGRTVSGSWPTVNVNSATNPPTVPTVNVTVQ